MITLTEKQALIVAERLAKARLIQARLNVRNKLHPKWEPLTVEPLDLALIALSDRLAAAMSVVVAACEYVDEICDTRGAYGELEKKVEKWRKLAQEEEPAQVWDLIG